MSRQSVKPGSSALVIGAGLAGMTAAFYLAEWGARTTLVDRAPHLGGAFLLLDHTFTTDSCGLCIALPRQPSYCPTLASELHPLITPLPRTTLGALEGQPGDFTAKLRHAARYVDPDLCDHCGACVTVCPVLRPRSGGMLGQQRAIYAPPPRAVPSTYAIDPDVCTRCGACEEICPRGAIDLAATPAESHIEVGAVVVAPGFAPFDATRAVEYGWGRCANVVTSLEFERLLNRSGPTGGRLFCGSDGLTKAGIGRPIAVAGQPPRRIAFIQCVGSRSERLGRPYCATSCCMITAKQVRLIKQVAPEVEVTVYTMDVRAAGKGYERYTQQVAALPGVTYCWERPAAVHEIPPGTARGGSMTAPLRVLTPGGEEVFDLVVLAVGMGPPDGMHELAAAAGIALDADGFVLPGDDGPGSTSRRGVFVAGCALAPVDVPEVVTQAAAAAALAARELPTTLRRTSFPFSQQRKEEASQLDQPPSVGLFLCTCRGTLVGALDYPALAAWVKRQPLGSSGRAVAHVERLEAACERSGLAAIERAVTAHGLNRIVVAGCSARLYGDRFDALMDRLDLPAFLLARANIREGAAWAHANGPAAVAAARGELAMAIAGLRETPESALDARVQQGVRGQQNTARRVLILGGGLAGMTAVLTLASLGIDADLVERRTHLGGNLCERLRTLEGLDAQALLAGIMADVRRAADAPDSPQVHIWTEAELVGWSGIRGDFCAEIRRGADGAEDPCRERYGALIVATGAEPAHASVATSAYLYGEHERVITQQEFEFLLAEDPASSLPFPLSSVVMIQCVGSRDEVHPYCSRVCCAAAIKNALALKALDPSIEVSILFRDIRTMGLHERYYQQARRLGVHFLRYEPPETPKVETEGDRLSVIVHDVLYEDRVTLAADLLVLSTGIVPAEKDNGGLAEMLGVPLDEDGFFAEAHPKLRPTDLVQPGIYLCGLAYWPRTITETVAQARAAALRAALDVARPPEVRCDIATVVPKLCSFCGLCVAHCPYGARVLDEEMRSARVIDHLCQGCGGCVAVCPNGASRQPALEPVRVLALVDAALAQETSI